MPPRSLLKAKTDGYDAVTTVSLSAICEPLPGGVCLLLCQHRSSHAREMGRFDRGSVAHVPGVHDVIVVVQGLVRAAHGQRAASVLCKFSSFCAGLDLLQRAIGKKLCAVPERSER